MTERTKILEYKENADGTVEVSVNGMKVGVFPSRDVARNSVDNGISKGISNLVKKITGKEDNTKI